MTKNLVTLVGQQPLTTLLSVRCLDPPEVLFVDTREWNNVSRHLQTLCGKERQVRLMEIRDPYHPGRINQQMKKKLRKLGWSPGNTIFDMSGGIRLMAFGIYLLAMEGRSALVDVEFVRRRHRLRLYKMDGEHYALEEDVELPDLITIADYINAHAPGFEVDGFSRDKRGWVSSGGKFESTIHKTLEPHVDEILSGVRPGAVASQIEIDTVVRCRNNVGLIEAKTGVNKAGIDQLDTAGNPSYLGRYATKFLITGRLLPRAHKSLALAQEIRVVELPGYSHQYGIPEQEERRLIQAVRMALVESRR